MKRKSLIRSVIVFLIALLVSQSVLATLAPVCDMHARGADGNIDTSASAQMVNTDAMHDMENCHEMLTEQIWSLVCDCADCQCDLMSTFGQAVSKLKLFDVVSESSNTPILIGSYPTIVSLIELPPQ